MQVTFYNFSKRQNSTAQPGTGTTVNVTLKDDCSITEPQLELNVAALNISNPKNFTYCRIPDFDRYYFCTGWSYYQGIWTGSFTVDVLASFKGIIGDSTRYVTRCASASSAAQGSYPASIADTLCPPLNDFKYEYIGMNNPLTDISFSSGSYTIVTCTGAAYSLTPLAYGSFLTNMTSSTDIRQYLNVGGSLSGLISNILWLPVEAGGGSAVSAVVLGAYTIPFTGTGYGITTIPTAAFNPFSAAIPRHPQAATKGNYLNYAPYSHYSATIPAFGNIDIPAEYAAEHSNAIFNLSVDRTTGQATLTLYADSDIFTSLVASSWTSSIGVSRMAAITQVNSYKVLAVAAQAAASAAGMVIGAATENFGAVATGVANLASAGISAAAAFTPMTSSTGSIGSMAALSVTPTLTASFQYVTDHNWDELGRPYCASVQISTLSGFVQCLDGDVAISGTDSERSQLSSFLTSGFFYE